MKQFFLITLLCVFMLGCEQGIPSQLLTAEKFETRLSETNTQLLDLRSPEAYSKGHLHNARPANWNEQESFKAFTGTLDKKIPVLIYDDSGGTSAEAAKWLQHAGFRVAELEGGIMSWQQSGKPVSHEAAPTPISLAEYRVMTSLNPVVLVDFGAAWCPPCKKMDPVLEQLQREEGNKFKLIKIDGGIQTALMKSVNAGSLPTFIIYKNGMETWRREGIVPISELKARINF
ncbi:MAG: hypothetical protein EOO04_11530 [Chitinophagaceae bacterium]|nr:MAG: hypothetical protein EOO04_11530 [Chitinophagaceae bacterium]